MTICETHFSRAARSAYLGGEVWLELCDAEGGPLDTQDESDADGSDGGDADGSDGGDADGTDGGDADGTDA